MLLEFFLKPVCSSMIIPPYSNCISKFMLLTFLENVLNLVSFTHASLSNSKLSSKFLSSPPRNREITLCSASLKICFPQQQKGVEEIMICFIKIQSENIKPTWSNRSFIFCIVCNFLKYDGFTFL